MKGILFKDWKIKAIAEDDREWQTRRVIKPQPDKGLSIACYTVNGKPIDWVLADEYGDPIDSKCPQPRYQVGEVVYIKEAYCPECYKIDGIEDACYKTDEDDLEASPTSMDCLQVKWQSPMFMPAWAARYFIKITDIRAERLQEITEEDAIAEGCRLIATAVRHYELKPIPHFTEPLRPYTYKDNFIGLWDSLNEKRGYPWESNPWVFVYSFKKAEK